MTEDDPIIEDIHAHTGDGWYGLACGDGWFPIVKDVHTQILARFPDYEIWQIKEKFGGLRFYCDVDGVDGIREIIGEAESRAWKTCEDCGSMETITTTGRPFWIRTLCEECGNRPRESKW